MNLAGKNLTETFVSSTGDFWAPYSNTGGLNQAAAVTLVTTGLDVVVTEADDAFSGSGNAISVVFSGPGEFNVDGENAYTGGTAIDGGEIVVGSDDSLGTGGITFGADAYAKLEFYTDASYLVNVDPTNVISVPDATDAIEFRTINYEDGQHLVLVASGAISTYALESAGGVTLETLRFTGAFDANSFVVSPDKSSGAAYISAPYSAARAAADEASILASPTPIVISDTAADISANFVAVETLIYDGLASSVFTSNASLFVNNVSNYLNVFGGGDSLTGSSGAHFNLYNTAGNWDGVALAGGTLFLTDAEASVSGADDTIVLTPGGDDSVSIYNSGNRGDSVFGSAATIYTTNTHVSAFGSANLIIMHGSGAEDNVEISGTEGYWDLVSASNSYVNISGAEASVVGGGNMIELLNYDLTTSQSAGVAVSLYATNGVADKVSGSNGVVYLTSAQAEMIGAGDGIIFAGDDTLTIDNGYTYLLFNPGLGGHEMIQGFGETGNNITFSHADFANFAAVSSHLSQSGDDAVITLNAADTITLKGVQASSLTASQFAFY